MENFREAVTNGVLLSTSHDGYVPHFGVIHRRVLMIAPDGTRLLGFDNAHEVPALGSRFKRSEATNDHWHRTETDPGRPYRFKSAETLIEDFFNEVDRVLGEHGVSSAVISEE